MRNQDTLKSRAFSHVYVFCVTRVIWLFAAPMVPWIRIRILYGYPNILRGDMEGQIDFLFFPVLFALRMRDSEGVVRRARSYDRSKHGRRGDSSL